MESINPKDVFIVIPSFNEGKVLQTTVQGLLPLGYSIVVVDDGSADNTASILSRLPVFALRHPVNLGQGAALQTGMTFALQQGAVIIVHFDADGQHPAEQIVTLMEPILRDEVDVVLGSRFLDAKNLELVPKSKQILLRFARIVDGLLSGVWLTDSHNGFWAFSRSAASRMNLMENGFAHATELLVQLRKAGLRYKEIPTAIRYSDYSRQKGQSMSNSLNIVLDVVLRRVLK